MDPTYVLNKEGFIAACFVVLGGFVGSGVIWVVRRLFRIGERVVDVGLENMKKVGDNIETQTGHMHLLTESSRRIEANQADHGRRLDEHGDEIKELKKTWQQGRGMA